MSLNSNEEKIQVFVTRAKDGHEESFAKLFEHFFDDVWKYVHFKVDSVEVEDLVSDTFLKMVENLKKYKHKPPSTFKSWLFRIAHNNVIDHYRKQKEILGIIDNDEEESLEFQIEDEKLTPDQETNLQLNTEKIHELLHILPENQQEILTLKYLAGMTNLEISEITGKSEGNVRVIQLRALKKLRDLWEASE